MRDEYRERIAAKINREAEKIQPFLGECEQNSVS